MAEIDIITVTAHQCVHCKQLFTDMREAFKHLDQCQKRPREAVINGKYIEDCASGNMILKEGI